MLRKKLTDISNKDVVIAPSLLAADFTSLKSEIEQTKRAGVEVLHIDVMDGHFVPNITMGPLVVKAVKKVTKLPLDVHLMIEHPDRYVSDFAEAGADYISVHAEASVHLNRTIQLIKSMNVSAGVVLNPSTPISAIEWVLEYIDFILLMTVNPGFGGQSFIENSIDKIRSLRLIIQERGLSALIQVDGGVSEKNIKRIALAGADVFVAGSAIFGTKDYKKTIENLKNEIM